MPVRVDYYTDPSCIWSWGAEPAVRRLMWEFGSDLEFRWIMGGLARRYGPEYRDEEGTIGRRHGCFADLMAHWLDVVAETGMPADPRLWTQNPLASSYPACQAVKAAAEQGATAAYAYLRRLREGIVLERRKLDHVDALVAEAGPAGLDVDRFRIDLVSNAIVEAFAADLEAARAIPDDARDAGAVRRTEGIERLSFPSAVFVGADGSRHAVWGSQPVEALREAALAAGAKRAVTRPAEPLEAVTRFGRLATREAEVLCERPAPVLQAELWQLARDWRVRAEPVLTGTVWAPV
jgi:predicted DsbA family dithiol-disulfide isomerase